MQNNSGSCVNFSEQENNECNNSIPISTNAIRAFWKIESVNDPFNIVINNFTEAFEFTEDNVTSSYEYISGTRLSNNLITIFEDGIKSSENKVLSLLLFDESDNENALLFIEDIDSTPEFGILNNNETLLDVSIVEEDQSKINFNT